MNSSRRLILLIRVPERDINQNIADMFSLGIEKLAKGIEKEYIVMVLPTKERDYSVKIL